VTKNLRPSVAFWMVLWIRDLRKSLKSFQVGDIFLTYPLLSFNSEPLIGASVSRPGPALGVAPPSPECVVPQTISCRLLFAAAASMNKRWPAEISRAFACLSAPLVSFGRPDLPRNWWNAIHLLLEQRGLRREGIPKRPSLSSEKWVGEDFWS
jgi:hypothetical protein